MASTDDAVVRLALGRGWLTAAQVEGARRSAAGQGLSLAQLLARHVPAAAPELAALAGAAPVAHTLASAPPPVAATLAAPPPSGLRPAAVVEDPARARAVGAVREVLARDPRFAPHLDLVLERRGVLGEGGMGVVHRVLDRRLGREAALKLMRDANPDPQDVTRFFREAELTARLDHPSVPPVYEAGTDAAGRPYLLMRLIEGQPLSDRIAALHDGGRRPGLAELRPLLEVLVKVGEAVARAHARRMVHRDLKPGNVMVGAHGEVLVLDWGLVRLLDGPADQDGALRKSLLPAAAGVELTQAGALLGTPGYMSPEQASGEAVDERTDVFALGAILSAILTGKAPVTGPTVMNVVAATVQGKIERPRARWSGCPAELDSIAVAALALDPARRTPTAEAFVDDLRAWLAGDDVPSHRYGPAERLLRGVRRHPVALVASAALALVVAVSGAAWVRVTATRAEGAQRERFERAMQELAEAEGAATRGHAGDAAALVSDALLLAGDAVRWPAARVLDLAGLPVDAARALDASIDDAASPPPLEALYFLHVLQVHASPATYGGRTRTPAMLRLMALASRGPDDEFHAFVEGTAALDSRRYAEAERRLSDAVARNPRMGWALVNRAAAREMLGQLDDAIADLGSAIEAGNSDPLVRRMALAKRARCRMLTGRRAGALADVDQALALGPTDRFALLTRADVLTSLDRADEAEAGLTTTLAAAPDDIEVLRMRSAARAQRGDTVGALEDLDRLLRLDHGDHGALAERGRLKLSTGDREGATRDVDEARRLAPDSPEVHYRAAIVACGCGRRDDALALIDRGVALSPPGLPTPLRIRAEVRRLCGDLPGARRDLDQAHDLAPTDTDVLLLRAGILLALGESRQGRADLDAMLELAPESARGRALRAEVRAHDQDFEGAVDDLDAALLASPRDATMVASRARMHLARGDVVCANRDAIRSLELHGGPGAIAVAAEVARGVRLHAPEIARDLARRAVASDPSSPEARRLLATFEGASVDSDPELARLVREGMQRLTEDDYVGAEAIGDRAVAHAPRSGEGYALRGRARGLRGNIAGAREDGDKAVELLPEAPEVWDLRGWARLDERDAAGALSDADEGLRRAPTDVHLKFLRINAETALGRYAQARTELDAILATLGPGDEFRSTLEQFRQALAGR